MAASIFGQVRGNRYMLDANFGRRRNRRVYRGRDLSRRRLDDRRLGGRCLTGRVTCQNCRDGYEYDQDGFIALSFHGVTPRSSMVYPLQEGGHRMPAMTQ